VAGVVALAVLALTLRTAAPSAASRARTRPHI
jgi:hypothetical protein